MTSADMETAKKECVVAPSYGPQRGVGPFQHCHDMAVAEIWRARSLNQFRRLVFLTFVVDELRKRLQSFIIALGSQQGAAEITGRDRLCPC